MRKNKEKGSTEKRRNPVAAALSGIVIIAFVKAFWPDVIPFHVFELWTIKGTVLDWFLVSWPVFVWAIGVNFLYEMFYLDPKRQTHSTGKVFAIGIFTSTIAGVFEEIIFRWLIFLTAIATTQLVNFLFFGWLGFGITEWVHMSILGPLVDWTTLGYMNEYIYHSAGWSVGAAMLYSNAFFRDGHKYQGLFGMVNSWFMGMFFFWLMFQFGLVAAILVHFMYDALIDTYVAVSNEVRFQRNRQHY